MSIIFNIWRLLYAYATWLNQSFLASTGAYTMRVHLLSSNTLLPAFHDCYPLRMHFGRDHACTFDQYMVVLRGGRRLPAGNRAEAVRDGDYLLVAHCGGTVRGYLMAIRACARWWCGGGLVAGADMARPGLADSVRAVRSPLLFGLLSMRPSLGRA